METAVFFLSLGASEESRTGRATVGVAGAAGGGGEVAMGVESANDGDGVLGRARQHGVPRLTRRAKSTTRGNEVVVDRTEESEALRRGG